MRHPATATEEQNPDRTAAAASGSGPPSRRSLNRLSQYLNYVILAQVVVVLYFLSDSDRIARSKNSSGSDSSMSSR